MGTSVNLVLTAKQRRKLAAIYWYILNLNKRRQKQTASQDTVDGQTRPTASAEPLEDGADE